MTTRTTTLLIVGALALAACTPLAAQNEQLAAREGVLEAQIDSAHAGTLHTPKMRRAEAAYVRESVTLDSLKTVHRQLDADLAALAADGTSVGALNPPRVPPLAVDSAKAHQRHLPAILYIGALWTGVEVGGRADHDPGGYDRQRFYGSKFETHYLAGCSLELAAEAAHVPRWLSLPATIGAAFRFEKVQGYPNRRDAINTGLGATTCAAWGFAFR